ncbi:hypothetical protein VUR80DRAFT_9453 [Thermomyces stellatus]
MKVLLFALELVAPSSAFLRLGCGTLTVQRLDPIFEEGSFPPPRGFYLHQIACGKASNSAMTRRATTAPGASPRTSPTTGLPCCSLQGVMANYYLQESFSSNGD